MNPAREAHIRRVWRTDKRLILAMLESGSFWHDGVWFTLRTDIQHGLPTIQVRSEGLVLCKGWMA